MTKKKLNCIEEDCGYQTQEVEQDLALQLLTLHVNTQYAQAATAEGRQHTAQAERIKRPVLTFTGTTLEQEDYEHFFY